MSLKTVKDENILSIAKKNHWSLRYSVPESLFLPEGINKDLNTWKKEAEFLEILSMKVNIGEINDKMIDFSILENLSFLITIENDQTKENGNIPSIVNALNFIKEKNIPIGYTFDIGNWQIMKQNLNQAFEQTKKFISIIHLKDVDKTNQTVLLNKGEIPWQNYLKKEIPIIIEYPIAIEDIEGEYNLVKEALKNG